MPSLSPSESLLALAESEAGRQAIFARLAGGEIDVFEAIFALDRHSAISDKKRKDGGVVYTPERIAREMCALAGPKLSWRVLEPSCGRGVFVFALAMHHLSQGALAKECADALAQNLRACDLDAEATRDLGDLWLAFWRSRGVEARPLITRGEDSLFAAFSEERFDLALGNPPYVRFQNLDAPYRIKLQGKYASCVSGNVDLYFAFIEQATRQAERVCFIVPNSWMSTKSGSALRALLLPRVTDLIDYGDELVFAPVRAYVCILKASGAARPQSAANALRFRLGSAEPTRWSSMPLSDPRLISGPWRLKAQRAAVGLTLGDIATLYSGIATLADSSYALSGAPDAAGMVSFMDKQTGRTLRVDESIAPRRVKLTKVKSEAELLACQERILFPYTISAAIIPEAALGAQHPDALAFLLARKARLAQRDKGAQEDYEAWYAYGRRQGLKPLPAGELCAVAGMSRDGIECFTFDSARAGRFLFTSGFILAPKPGHTSSEIISALRHPDSWKWALAHGKEWAGSEGKVYRSYGSRLLAQLPIPNSLALAPSFP